MQNNQTARRVGRLLANKKVRFIGAGILNTLVDFTGFNIAIFVLGLKPWMANILSASIAMVISFAVNKRAVFRYDKAARHTQFIAFIVVTAVGVWGLQTAVVVGGSAFLGPIAHRIFDSLGRSGAVTWVVPNAAKALATVLTAIWNYLWYDHVIFAQTKKVKLQEWL
jgi:putative flippase GtrA